MQYHPVKTDIVYNIGSDEYHMVSVSMRRNIHIGQILHTFASKLDAVEWLRVQEMKYLLADFKEGIDVILLRENSWGWYESQRGRCVELKWSSISGPWVRRSFSNKVWFVSDLQMELEKAVTPKPSQL